MPTETTDVVTYALLGDSEGFFSLYKDTDLHKQDEEEKLSLLQYALMGHNLEICQFLVDQGSELNKQFSDGSTELHQVAFLSSRLKSEEDLPKLLKLAEDMLQRGADPNLKDKYGNTPLWTACDNGYPTGYRLVKLFLKYGADPDLPMNGGYTPKDIVKMRGGTEDLLRILEDKA